MTQEKQPWITTDGKIIYFIFTGSFSPALKSDRDLRELSRRWERVTNIYGLDAFALDDRFERIFCVRNLECCALADLNPRRSSSQADVSILCSYEKSIEPYIVKINDALSHLKNPTSFVIEGFRAEVSNRIME